MKIGLLLPAKLSLHGAGNGVRAQALAQAAALEQCGVSVAIQPIPGIIARSKKGSETPSNE